MQTISKSVSPSFPPYPDFGDHILGRNDVTSRDVFDVYLRDTCPISYRSREYTSDQRVFQGLPTSPLPFLAFYCDLPSARRRCLEPSFQRFQPLPLLAPFPPRAHSNRGEPFDTFPRSSIKRIVGEILFRDTIIRERLLF